MDKKQKDAIRRYKKIRARDASSSESSSSSDSESGSSSSYSSSDSDHKSSATRRHRKKKLSRSDEERRKREKREHCQKKFEAKREHLKRKLKEAKLKRKAAAAAAVLSGHSHRSSLSPMTQAKLKKLAERRHLREASKERREREKRLIREREHAEHEHSRSPSKLSKMRLHSDILNRTAKSPQRMHQQLMSREKIIIQTRTHDRTPSVERERVRDRERSQRHDHKIRRDRDRERAEREAARDKERAEALARCQERQRERERIAREKLRREDEEKKYGSVERSAERNVSLLNDYDMIYHGSGHSYTERERERDRDRERERSLEALERTRYNTKRELDLYERECNYLDVERRAIPNEGELSHDRSTSRRRDISPNAERYMSRQRDMRDIYGEDERERSFNRSFHGDAGNLHYARDRNNWSHTHDMRDSRDGIDYNKREHGHVYDEVMLRGEHKDSNASEWKNNWGEQNEWGTVSGTGTPCKLNKNRNDFKQHAIENKMGNERRIDSEPDWDADEHKDNKYGIDAQNNDIKIDNSGKEPWLEGHNMHDNKMNSGLIVRENSLESGEIHSRQNNDWQKEIPDDMNQQRLLSNNANFNRARAYRERAGSTNYRGHSSPIMNIAMMAQVPVALAAAAAAAGPSPRPPFHANQRVANKRNMTYTNPNIIKKQQAALAAAKAATQANAVAAATAVAAAKAAAQSAANATTNPGILGQVRQFGTIYTEKPEAGEIVGDEPIKEDVSNLMLNKVSGELSEISDSEDEILNNIEKKPEDNDLEGNIQTIASVENVCEENGNVTGNVVETETTLTAVNEDDDMLAFEEISDGEFEEDARLKNVADALGVDWASLITESKAQATELNRNSNELTATSAKERWQSQRILLQVGVSYRLAGEDFAKRLLAEMQGKLNEEENVIKNEEDLIKKEDIKANDVQLENEIRSVEEPLAFSQVFARQQVKMRNKLFADVCGPYSRALSARQDLRLRRQLCGLPDEEYEIGKPLPLISKKLKNMALNAFKCTLEVK